MYILLATSKSAAGITGSSFIILGSTLAVLKIILVEGIVLLVGIDRMMSEGPGHNNIIGSTVVRVVIPKSKNEIDVFYYTKGC